MIHPDRALKHAWDLLVILLIGATAVEIPARIALAHPVADWLRGLDLLITVVFALDIVLSFNTARRVRGELEWDRSRVARRYLKGWFAVDLVSAVPLAALLGPVLPAARPWLLLARMARILKLPLLRAQLHRWEAAHVVSPNVVRVALFALGVLLLSHWVACGWILIGSGSGRAGVAYLDALYWSVTTLTTVGYGDITPTGSGAKIYTMGVMFLGVGMYAAIIGSIARLIADLDHARTLHDDRMKYINAFMVHHDLPQGLRRRVRDYYHYLWLSRRGIEEASLKAELPPHLGAEVALHLLRDILQSVPLFENAPPEFLRTLALRLEPRLYGPGEYVVRRGERDDRMFLVGRGSVEVLSEDESEVVSTLAAGDHFGEIALVYGARRNRSVRTLEFCDLYALDRACFEDVLRDFPELAERVRRVAQERREA